MTALVVTAAVLTLGGLAACSGGAVSTPSGPGASSPALPTTPASGPRRLSETGSSLMAPLFTQWWAPAYHAPIANASSPTTTNDSRPVAT